MKPEPTNLDPQAFLDAARQLEGEERQAFLDRIAARSVDLLEGVKALLEEGSVEGDRAPEVPARLEFNADSNHFVVETGTTIDDYTLVRKLGQGGMGEVWEARQGSLSRRVALKLLPPGRASERGLEFFAREARAGGRLSHPNIVSVHGTGESGGIHWIAMELIEDGFDLRESLDSLRDEPELPSDYYQHCASFLAELAEALETAHQADVIHRDLKPANILVTPEDRPKVTDFGLAKLTDENSLSMVGELMGSYYYMSPEQVATKRMGLDHRTDIFSLGVVMYEMLTLVRPFEGDTTEQIARKIMLVDPQVPDELRSRVPRDLSVICGKCLEKEPDRRYPSMAELAADLRRHLAHEPIKARPPGPVERAMKWVRRHPTRSAALGVGAVALVGLLGLWWRAEQQRTRAEGAERETAAALDRVEDEKSKLASSNELLEIKTAEADRNAGLAMARADELERTNEELQQVSDFQAKQLSEVDPDAMGIAIRRSVLERARAAGERAGRSAEVLEEEGAELERLLAGADFTGIAVGVLDEQIFGRALAELESFGNQPLLQARLLQTVGDTLRELGLLDRAQEPQEQALEIRRRVLGDEDPETLNSINSLGGLFRYQGKYDEAEPLFREALEVRRRTLGDEHPGTLTLISNLGALFHAQGKYDEAEPLFREALEVRRRTLGDEHPDTLGSIGNLSLLFLYQGKYDEAEPLYREVLKVRRRTLGDEHPATMASISNLGVLFHNQGKYEEAEKHFVEALEGRRRVLGETHPTTLATKNALESLRADREAAGASSEEGSQEDSDGDS